jgi:hypothetical protein
MTASLRLTLCAGLLGLGLSVAPGAQAQKRHDGTGGLASACQADFKKFCADTQPGDGRIAACLHEHAAELAPDCKTALRAARKARAAQPASAAAPAK